ncbi:MAG: general secretion pathway protein GspK [Bdellovibrio sp.]|jgi:general secretion pathway protein K
MRFTRDLLSSRNQKGIAIIMAVFCTVLILYIVNEVTYETNVEYMIHAQSVNRLKAYYAARSGVELSLLRIKVYKTVQKQYGAQLGAQAGLLNLIWSFPLGWPPTLPTEASGVEKEGVQDKVKEAQMDANFNATIFDEGSKVDINDLTSPSKALAEITKKQVLKIFETKIELEPEWARTHQDLVPTELVNNIIDWLDADTQSLNNGDERQFYKDVPDTAKTFPPNRAFRTLNELRLVAGMKDEYFDLLAPSITVFGAKAINPNSASKEVLKSLDSSITDKVVAEIITRRDDPSNGGFFSKDQEFWDFVNSKDGRVSPDVQKDTPLIFDAVSNFSIRSVGEYNGAIREINAVVFDIASAADIVGKKLKAEKAAAAGPGANPAPPSTPGVGSGPSAGAPSAGRNTPSKGPPRIVYWYEK